MIKIPKNIKLAILDLDGTLLDSTTIWDDIDREFFFKRGLEVPEGYGPFCGHIGLDKAAIYTKETFNLPDSPEDILKEWNDASLKMYQEIIQLKPKALQLLNELKKNGIILACATANKKSLYEPCIKRLGIYEYFDLCVDVDVVKTGKHSPEIYNYISNHFNIDKKDTLVFEDNQVAIKTAHDDGYVVIAVKDQQTDKYIEDKRKNSLLLIDLDNSI